MLYMVIERFKQAPAIYQRLREKGRMMPQGLEYISSWIGVDRKICWQLMRTEDESLFQRWIENWKDLLGRIWHYLSHEYSFGKIKGSVLTIFVGALIFALAMLLSRTLVVVIEKWPPAQEQ